MKNNEKLEKLTIKENQYCSLVWFYGISTIGYLMPNPFLFIYIKYDILKQVWAHFSHTVQWFNF